MKYAHTCNVPSSPATAPLVLIFSSQYTDICYQLYTKSYNEREAQSI